MLKICIQNLGMYNEGVLLFKWLELPVTEEEIDDALTEIHICHEDVDGNYVSFTDEFGSPYEEMHIPDWECDIPGIEYGEWNSISYYNEIAEKLDGMREYEMHWLSSYLEATGCGFEEGLENYEDSSRYWDNMSKSDVAREMADERIEGIAYIPNNGIYGDTKRIVQDSIEWLSQYFDYDAYERSLDLTETEYGVIETW